MTKEEMQIHLTNRARFAARSRLRELIFEVHGEIKTALLLGAVTQEQASEIDRILIDAMNISCA